MVKRRWGIIRLCFYVTTNWRHRRLCAWPPSDGDGVDKGTRWQPWLSCCFCFYFVFTITRGFTTSYVFVGHSEVLHFRRNRQCVHILSAINIKRQCSRRHVRATILLDVLVVMVSSPFRNTTLTRYVRRINQPSGSCQNSLVADMLPGGTLPPCALAPPWRPRAYPHGAIHTPPRTRLFLCLASIFHIDMPHACSTDVMLTLLVYNTRTLRMSSVDFNMHIHYLCPWYFILSRISVSAMDNTNHSIRRT